MQRFVCHFDLSIQALTCGVFASGLGSAVCFRCRNRLFFAKFALLVNEDFADRCHLLSSSFGVFSECLIHEVDHLGWLLLVRYLFEGRPFDLT